MTVSVLSILVAAAFGSLVTPPDGRSARIDVTPGETYTVQAVVVTDRAASGTYSLVVDRVGVAGRSRSQQGGAFETESQGEQSLSTSSVNVAAGDTLRAELTVTWADGVVTRDEVRMPSRP